MQGRTSLETVALPLSRVSVSLDCLFSTISMFQSHEAVSFPLSVRFSLMRRPLFHSQFVSVSWDCSFRHFQPVSISRDSPFTTLSLFQSRETVSFPISVRFNLVRLSLFHSPSVSVSWGCLFPLLVHFSLVRLSLFHSHPVSVSWDYPFSVIKSIMPTKKISSYTRHKTFHLGFLHITFFLSRTLIQRLIQYKKGWMEGYVSVQCMQYMYIHSYEGEK